MPRLAIREQLALTILLAVGATGATFSAEAPDSREELRRALQKLPYKLVFETYRDGNWELYTANADGSHPVNLTRTPDVDELYPKVSPDGTKICFVLDRGEGESKTRSVYYMNSSGTGRTLVASNARWPCWSPDGKTIAFLRNQYAPDEIAKGATADVSKVDTRFSYWDYATKGLFFYDVKTGTCSPHQNRGVHHLHNICFTPDCNWIVATVHAGMGYGHANLAIDVDGPAIVDLGMRGCRPDVRGDGKKIAWSPGDFWVGIADLNFAAAKVNVTNERYLVTTEEPFTIYHADWSPDGRYIAFSGGPHKKRLGWHPALIGIPAPGWNICIADSEKPGCWIAVTTDGLSNKEPDWTPGGQESERESEASDQGLIRNRIGE